MGYREWQKAHFIRLQPDSCVSPVALELTNSVNGRQDPTISSRFELFYLPPDALLGYEEPADVKRRYFNESQGWVCVEPPIVRCWFDRTLSPTRLANINYFPPTGSLDEFIDRFGQPVCPTLWDLVDQVVEKLGWTVSPELQAIRAKSSAR